ncbi:unnamed protein product [Amoebophrya sp. A120]|nr:unnamed protein product [Amoebophrya sp. A120]|eukprot:GSA120T00011960001.1
MKFHFDVTTCFGLLRKPEQEPDWEKLDLDEPATDKSGGPRKFAISSDELHSWPKKVKNTDELSELVSPVAPEEEEDEQEEADHAAEEHNEHQQSEGGDGEGAAKEAATTPPPEQTPEQTPETNPAEQQAAAPAAGQQENAPPAGAPAPPPPDKAEPPPPPAQAYTKPGNLVCVSSVKHFGAHHTGENAERAITDSYWSFWGKPDRVAALSSDPSFAAGGGGIDTWFEVGCPYAGVQMSIRSKYASTASRQAKLPILCEPKTFPGKDAIPCDACYSWQDHIIDWNACKPDKEGDPPKCALVPEKELVLGSRQVIGPSAFSAKAPAPRDNGKHNLGGMQFVADVKNYFTDPEMVGSGSQSQGINVILHHPMPLPPIADTLPDNADETEEEKTANLNKSGRLDYLYPEVTLSLPKYKWLQAYARNAKVFDDLLKKEQPRLSKMSVAQDYNDMCQGLQDKDVNRYFSRLQQMFADCQKMQSTFIELIRGPDKTEGTTIPILDPETGMTSWQEATEIGNTCGGLTNVDFENAKVNYLNLCKRTD